MQEKLVEYYVKSNFLTLFFSETINVNIKQEPNTNNNGKRKASRDREQFSDNEEEEEIPTNDLYRKRQQKRIK